MKIQKPAVCLNDLNDVFSGDNIGLFPQNMLDFNAEGDTVRIEIYSQCILVFFR